MKGAFAWKTVGAPLMKIFRNTTAPQSSTKYVAARNRPKTVVSERRATEGRVWKRWMASALMVQPMEMR